MDTTDSELKNALEKMPGISRVLNVEIRDCIIENASFETKGAERLVLERLVVDDAEALFDFYFNGLSEKSREFFPPYPLFSPPVCSAMELAGRIADWQREDDWTVLKLVDKAGQIIGIGLLKRFKTERPVSGLAVKEEFQGKGLGFIIQKVITEQARLLKLKHLYVTLAEENVASFNLHKKCGFEPTGNVAPHYIYRYGEKEVDRMDIEMLIKFD